jgi:hypothetical protein
MMKHSDDDGDLSVIAGKGQILFACSKGHYWIVEAQEGSVSLEEEPSRRLTDFIGRDRKAMRDVFPLA